SGYDWRPRVARLGSTTIAGRAGCVLDPKGGGYAVSWHGRPSEVDGVVSGGRAGEVGARAWLPLGPESSRNQTLATRSPTLARSSGASSTREKSQEVLALAFLIIASVTAAVRIGSAGRPNPAAWRGRGRSG